MKWWQKLLLLLSCVIILVISAITIMGYRQYQEAICRVPLKEKIEEIRNRPNFTDYEDISKNLINATIAVEDRRFYHHGGVDYLATTRAILGNLIGQNKSGGSTITQQLGKNLYFGYEPSLIRKVAELFVAEDLERTLTKEEILTLYVNVINYGDNHMGIYDAAYGYFGIAPSQLSLAQASMLAGLPQSPANYQLSDHYDNAKKRQEQVLSAMVKAGYIDEEEKSAALSESIMIP